MLTSGNIFQSNKWNISSSATRQHHPRVPFRTHWVFTQEASITGTLLSYTGFLHLGKADNNCLSRMKYPICNPDTLILHRHQKDPTGTPWHSLQTGVTIIKHHGMELGGKARRRRRINVNFPVSSLENMNSCLYSLDSPLLRFFLRGARKCWKASEQWLGDSTASSPMA